MKIRYVSRVILNPSTSIKNGIDFATNYCHTTHEVFSTFFFREMMEFSNSPIMDSMFKICSMRAKFFTELIELLSYQDNYYERAFNRCTFDFKEKSWNFSIFFFFCFGLLFLRLCEELFNGFLFPKYLTLSEIFFLFKGGSQSELCDLYRFSYFVIILVLDLWTFIFFSLSSFAMKRQASLL